METKYQERIKERQLDLELERKISGRYLSLPEHIQFWQLVEHLRQEETHGNKT